MPQTEEQLFVITASNADAQRHVEHSIANSIDSSLCAKHCDSAVLENVRQRSTDDRFYAWGADQDHDATGIHWPCRAAFNKVAKLRR